MRRRSRSSISTAARASASGALDQVTTDIAADLKRRGVRKGSRVLLLSDENLEKLLIWLGVWRIGAVICPINIEINQKHMAEVAEALKPAVILHHKDIDVASMVGDNPAPRIKFGKWSADGGARPAGRIFRCAFARRCRRSA